MKRRSLFLGAVAALALAAANTSVASAIPPTPTLTLTATPSAVKTGEPITYNISLSPAADGGTVLLLDNGMPIAACQAQPVTNGTASCATTAAASVTGTHFIYALYSGNGMYGVTSGYAQVPVTAQTTTVATASPKLADPGQTMTYKAVVTPRPNVGEIASCSLGCGGRTHETVNFLVDGATACAARPVDGETGVATCTAAAPTAGGTHVLKADYSGSADDYMTVSSGTDDFAVKAPAVSLSTGALDFGSLTVGKSATQQVTVANSGTRELHVGALALAGGFSVAANGCDGATLAPNAGCAITVAFAPTAVGTASGTLTVASDAGEKAVALTGTGVAVATTAPTGATLPPNAKSTFTATTSGNSSSVTVPLRCPNGIACTLDGTVVISTGDLASGARATAVKTQTVARFAGVRVAAGKVKQIKLKLSPAFVKTAQKRGVRYIHAVLTVNTAFADGSHATRQERVTIRIPKAAKKAVKKQAAVAPHFTG